MEVPGEGGVISITKDFELFGVKTPGGGVIYPRSKADALLSHARALEKMLKKHEWSENPEGVTERQCMECGVRIDYPFQAPRHAHDCQLSKLLEGVEE